MTTLEAHSPEDRAALVRLLGQFSKPKRKRSKYNNKRVYLDGKKFDSIAESEHYLVLKDMEARGEIKNLELQPKFPLYAHGPRGEQIKIGTYIADFAYWDVRAKEKKVVDVKGLSPPVYRLKKKLFEANYAITISEVRK